MTQLTLVRMPTAGSPGPVPDGPLTGVTFGDTISVVGADEDGDLFRYWWQVGGAWQAQNLTDIAVPV